MDEGQSCDEGRMGEQFSEVVQEGVVWELRNGLGPWVRLHVLRSARGLLRAQTRTLRRLALAGVGWRWLALAQAPDTRALAGAGRRLTLLGLGRWLAPAGVGANA